MALRAATRLQVTTLLFVFFCSTAMLRAQSASTGALTVTAKDQSGAIIAGARVTISNSSGLTRTNTTAADGSSTFPQLPPDGYRVDVAAPGFKTFQSDSVTVHVTETETLEAKLTVGQQTDRVEVTADASLLQTETSALGGVVGSQNIAALPLTTRDYLQIMNLSPGVGTDVTDATAAGRGLQSIYVNGKDATNSNFHVDGVTVSNYGSGGEGAGFFNGASPVPSPDALQEFKVLTSNFDASYGRNSGANVNVVTKSGSNVIHGSAFEYFRNTDLNANTFFRNEGGLPLGVLNQNQFGGTVGGPVKKDKLFFFLSGQGTRQKNGIVAGGTETPTLPEQLTNDRSLLGLENAFCATNPSNLPGQPGYANAHSFAGGQQLTCPGGGPPGQGTVAVPVNTPGGLSLAAYNILNAKLPNGQYAVPTPQIIRKTGSNVVGLATLEDPLTFNESQGLASVDYNISSKNTFTAKWFWDQGNLITPYTSTLPDGGSNAVTGNSIASGKLTTLITPNLINEARFSYNFTRAQSSSLIPFTSQELGMTPSNPTSSLPPTISVTGLFTSFGGIFDATKSPVTNYEYNDQISWTHGRHTIRAGFNETTTNFYQCSCGKLRGSLTFNSFADFLLGESAAENGSPTGLSNIQTSSATIQLWSSPNNNYEHYASAFVQDDYKVSNRLTLNLGLRWEYLGTMADRNTLGGTNGNWGLAASVPIPPVTGTYVGWTVAQDYTGPMEPGLVRRNTNLFTNGDAPYHNFAPRLGAAWQPFGDKLVIRAGGGFFYDIVYGNQLIQTGNSTPPNAAAFAYTGAQNGLATFEDPFNPTVAPGGWAGFLRTPTSALTMHGIDPNLLTPLTFSWNSTIQYAIKPSLVVEVGYVGNRSEHQAQNVLYDIPELATAGNPLNCGAPSGCITTNTAANAAKRLPVLGFGIAGVSITTNSGDANYNAVQASIQKRFSHGLQFQVSYTYGRCFNDMIGLGGGGGETANQGDPTNRAQLYGPCDYTRPQRFVANYNYFIPSYQHGNKVVNTALSGWSLAGVTTIQDGYPLTIGNATGGAVYGFPDTGAAQAGGYSRAEMCPGYTYSDIVNPGPVSSKLTDYFNASAVNCAIPIIGQVNGVGGATGYGNSGRNIVLGPGQMNFDASILKKTVVGGINENAYVEFRTDFFNLANHAQFQNPSNATVSLVSSPATFGVISGTNVGPRVIQFALRYNF
jgi:hypothetical protein